MSRRKGSRNTHLIRTTTVALSENEFLKKISSSSIVETYCEGYEIVNGKAKRKKGLDGHYFNNELKLKYIPNNLPVS